MNITGARDATSTWKKQLLLVALTCSAVVFAAEPELSAEAQDAVQRAKQLLTQQVHRSAKELSVTSVAAKEWSDSSLGCRKPGMSYAHVITKGYVVLLHDGEKTHEVHVAGNQAIVCDAAIEGGFREPRAPVRATHLAELERLAREDLATKLKVNPNEIRILQRVPKRWTQASLECVPAQTAAGGEDATIPGFKLFLRHKMRTYTYHTDEQRVYACPAIAQE